MSAERMVTDAVRLTDGPKEGASRDRVEQLIGMQAARVSRRAAALNLLLKKLGKLTKTEEEILSTLPWHRMLYE